MSKNYRELTNSVKSRINPDNVMLRKGFTDELSTLSYSDVLTYIRVAMKSVEPEYTQKSKDAGERVKEHLKVLPDVTFRYQGSVMTNTHIKGYSDIDLLTICDKFYSYDIEIQTLLNNFERRQKFNQTSISKLESVVNSTNYAGDSLEDLKNLRVNSEKTLLGKYLTCDISKPKSIKITNTNLRRDVDIVIANWFDDTTSIINDKGEYRGIQIYNKAYNLREKADYPFTSIKRINDRSILTNGNLKKMIRFLKNTKANSDHEIDLSSFDINAICYDIEVSKYQNINFYALIPILYYQLKSICTNQSHANRIISVDGREYIFSGNSIKLANLRKLLSEVEGVFTDYIALGRSL